MKTMKATKSGQYIAWLTILCCISLCSLNVSAKGKTLIFPIPQQIQLTSDIFIMDETVSVIIPEKMSRNDLFLARFLARELSDKYDIALKIEPCKDIPKNRKVVIMGRFDNPLVKRYCKANNLEVSEKSFVAEGYRLLVNKNIIIIAGSDDAGAFYGLQSLRQIIYAGNGKEIQGLDVSDWPCFPFRAIKLYVPGPENITYFRKFLRDFMSLYKFNKVIIEFPCMRLDKHPELNTGWIAFAKYMHYSRSNNVLGINGGYKNSPNVDAGDGYIIEKSDVKDIVDYANENFIEVIPELMTLTHSYYLLTRHPELAEYVGDKWPSTYCPSNPETYKLVFDVFDEYIEVIKPKMVSIGHDEWWGAPIGSCPLCTGKDYSVLFAGDINKIYDYLDAKGVKTTMWGDFLLESVRGKGPQNRTSTTGVKYQTPGATRPEVVRDSIPKDILISNWFWEDQDKEMELQKFGFKQIYGNLTPNIRNWDERVRKFDLLGGAPSSWASTNEFNFGKDLMTDFLGCANLVWSKHTLNQKDLEAKTSELMPYIRSNLNISRIPSKDGDEMVPVNISDNFNISRDTKVFNASLISLKSGEVKGDTKIFSLVNSADPSAKVAIAAGCSGKDQNLLPGEVNGITVNEDVSSLIFLHACALPAENHMAHTNIINFFDTADLLGWYEIVYEDEFREIVPIQYKVNILEFNPEVDRPGTLSGQNDYCYLADPVNCSDNSTANPIIFYSYEWVNKRFGKKIMVVNLHGTVNYISVTGPIKSNAILLAGITKVRKRIK